MADEKNRPFQMRVSAQWLAVLDDWRRTQPDLPSRAEAIRRLAARALALEKLGYDGRVEHPDYGVGFLLFTDAVRLDEAMVNFGGSDRGERTEFVSLDELSAHKVK